MFHVSIETRGDIINNVTCIIYEINVNYDSGFLSYWRKRHSSYYYKVKLRAH